MELHEKYTEKYSFGSQEIFLIRDASLNRLNRIDRRNEIVE